MGGRGVAGRPAADDHEAQRHGGEATDPLSVPGHGRPRRPLQSDGRVPQCPVPGDGCRRQPPRPAQLHRPIGGGGERAGHRARPTSSSGPRRPTRRCAAAWARAAPAARCAATATRSSAARSTAPTRCPSGLAHRRLVEGRRLELLRRRTPATTWTATSPAAAAAAAAAASAAAPATARRAAAARGRCDHRKAGCTALPLRQLQQPHRVHRPDPVPGRHLHRAVADRAHVLDAAPCAPTTTPVATTARASRRARRSTRWPATGTATARDGIGFYDNRNGALDAAGRPPRRAPLADVHLRARAGRPAGRRRLERRRRRQHRDLPQGRSGTSPTRSSAPHDDPPASTYGVQAGDIPVVGDWNGDGVDGLGIFRKRRVAPLATAPSTPQTVAPVHLRHAGRRHPRRRRLERRRRRRHRRSSATGEWHLSNSLVAGAHRPRRSRFGVAPGDIPVVGDWTGSGGTASACTGPSEGTWYLRDTLADSSPIDRHVRARRWVVG